MLECQNVTQNYDFFNKKLHKFFSIILNAFSISWFCYHRLTSHAIARTSNQSHLNSIFHLIHLPPFNSPVIVHPLEYIGLIATRTSFLRCPYWSRKSYSQSISTIWVVATGGSSVVLLPFRTAPSPPLSASPLPTSPKLLTVLLLLLLSSVTGTV